MRNAYLEVLRTYWRRMFSSWVTAACVVPQLLLAGGILVFFPRFRADQIMMVAMVVAFIGGPMWGHFREQVVDERRRLWPGFRKPHVVVFTLLLLLIGVAWPGALILLKGLGSFGLIAFTMTMMALIGLWVLSPRVYLMIIWFAGWIWLISGTAGAQIQRFLDGRYETLAIGLLLGSLVVITVVLIRMVRLTEEDPVYHRRLQYSGAVLRPRMTGETNLAWSAAQRSTVFGKNRPGGMIYIPKNGSTWEGARRWLALGGRTGWSFLVLSILMIASFELISLASDHSPELPIIAIWLVVIPLTMVGGGWLARWRFMEMELLRPIARAAFFKQVGLAMAINMLQAWCMMALVLAVDVMFIARRMMDGRSLAMLLGCSLVLQGMGFGASVWAMRYRSQARIMFILPVLIIPSMFIMIAFADGDLSKFHLPALIVAIVVGLAGLLIARDAYRRWLVTELG